MKTITKALEYAMGKGEDPTRMKEHVEEYFNAIGGDRRYKLKWCAISCNHKYTFSGIFEYTGKRYYFSKKKGELELEYY